MSIKARLKRLEKKVAANEPPQRQLGMFAGQPIWRTEERDGVVYCLPRFEPGEFEERCLAQQTRLMKELADYNAQLDQANEAPVVGILIDTQAPGTKRPNFIFRNEGGKESQIDVRDGTRTVV